MLSASVSLSNKVPPTSSLTPTTPPFDIGTGSNCDDDDKEEEEAKVEDEADVEDEVVVMVFLRGRLSGLNSSMASLY